MTTELVFDLSLWISFYMLGVIWIIQLLQYPGFQFIDPYQFPQAHSRHSLLMGFLVGPAMVIELLSGLWLLLKESSLWSFTNLFIVLLLWGLTFFVSVPLHNRLSRGFDITLIRRLIQTNWPRTFFWTLKTLLNLFWLFSLKLS